ncbi:MAG: hypothetical protein K0S21_945 [Rhizobiaceae bacterium]|jgi:hypothetical protein|nr:hypothetical protein [Rhizobiaceae bacterium]
MKSGPGDTSVLSAVAFLLAGPVIWAAHLLLLYGPQSALCAFGQSGVAEVSGLFVTAQVLAVTALAAVPLVVFLLRPITIARLFRFRVQDEEHPFSMSVMRWLSALSLMGVLLAGAAAFLLDPCAQLR